MDLVPLPARVTTTPGGFALTAGLRIHADGALADAARVLQTALRTAIGIPLGTAASAEDAGILLQQDPRLEDEAYVLEVTPERIRIDAGGDCLGHQIAEGLAAGLDEQGGDAGILQRQALERASQMQVGGMDESK